CVFFFSSRRRHTRFSRDWSSDVCSSDLHALGHHFLFLLPLGHGQALREVAAQRIVGGGLVGDRVRANAAPHQLRQDVGGIAQQRSEERRVGKECRSRGARAAASAKTVAG